MLFTLSKEKEEEIKRKLSPLFKKMMKTLFNEKGAALRVDIVAEPQVQKFIESHAALLDSAFSHVEMSESMRQSLRNSDYIFSGLKTFHELNEAFSSLIDENGNRKPFNRFLNDVQSIDNAYNRNYLRAEYNFVQSSALMAAKWEKIERDGDRYNLRYRTAGDGRVRPEHAALNGVTLPPSDPFWSSCYPPNGWRCRCSVVQVLKDKYPETDHDDALRRADEALSSDKKGIFRFNSGQKRKTFPDYNPYTIRRCNDCDIARGKASFAFVPETELCSACQLVRSLKEEQLKTKQINEKLYDKYKNDPEYEDVQFDKKTGGLKATHIAHNFDNKKGWYEKEVQDVGYKHGYSVIYTKETHNVYKKRNIEGYWNGLEFEVAGSETANPVNIRNALKHCARKPDTKIAILFFPENNFNVDDFNMGFARYNGLKNTSQYKCFNLIYCIQKGKIVYIKKPSS